HDEPGRRFQNAAAFETALLRALMVERRIVRQAERGWRDVRATRLENGEDDQAATSLDVAPPQAQQHREGATRKFSLEEISPAPSKSICWRCGGHNEPGAQMCRVCGARQPLPGEEIARGAPVPRRQARTTHKLPPDVEESGWGEWGEEEVTEDT